MNRQPGPSIYQWLRNVFMVSHVIFMTNRSSTVDIGCIFCLDRTGFRRTISSVTVRMKPTDFGELSQPGNIRGYRDRTHHPHHQHQLFTNYPSVSIRGRWLSCGNQIAFAQTWHDLRMLAIGRLRANHRRVCCQRYRCDLQPLPQHYQPYKILVATAGIAS